MVAATARKALLASHGLRDVVLSSANSFSAGRTRKPFAAYVSTDMPKQRDSSKANETWYFFGENFSDEWEALYERYALPDCGGKRWCGAAAVAFSFGVAGKGSGVQFHMHGAAFAEQLHGRKRWLLYPPHTKPPGFDPDMPVDAWVRDVLPGLPPEARPMDATLEPGEVRSPCRPRRAAAAPAAAAVCRSPPPLGPAALNAPRRSCTCPTGGCTRRST